MRCVRSPCTRSAPVQPSTTGPSDHAKHAKSPVLLPCTYTHISSFQTLSIYTTPDAYVARHIALRPRAAPYKSARPPYSTENGLEIGLEGPNVEPRADESGWTPQTRRLRLRADRRHRPARPRLGTLPGSIRIYSSWGVQRAAKQCSASTCFSARLDRTSARCCSSNATHSRGGAQNGGAAHCGRLWGRTRRQSSSQARGTPGAPRQVVLRPRSPP